MQPFTKRIHEALDFAAIHHKRQKRKDPDLKIPYISHLFGVSYILAQYDFGEDVIVAGVLHDIIEDVIEKKKKPQLVEVVKKKFGKKVYMLIDWVSQVKKDSRGKKIPWKKRNDAYRKRLQKAPYEAKAISCADKIHNIESLLMGFERGQKMWKRVKSTPTEQIEKFNSLHTMLSSNWKHPMLSELKRKIDGLEHYRDTEVSQIKK